MLEYNNQFIINACIVNTLIDYSLYIQTMTLYSKVEYYMLFILKSIMRTMKNTEIEVKVRKNLWANF